MSEIINWLRSKPAENVVPFIFAYGGHTIDWTNGDAVADAEEGEGADEQPSMGWRKSGNPITLADKPMWMEAISEVFKGREYDPYVWKAVTHPNNPTVDIDYFKDADGDTWFGIFTYNGGVRGSIIHTKEEMLDSLNDAFPKNS